MERIGKLTKDILNKIIFDLNNNPHLDGSDTPSSKFLSKEVLSYLPNSLGWNRSEGVRGSDKGNYKIIGPKA